MNGELSDYWGEESSGIDLATRYFTQSKFDNLPRAVVGVIDDDKTNPEIPGEVGHGILVTHAIQSGERGSGMNLATLWKNGSRDFYNLVYEEEKWNENAKTFLTFLPSAEGVDVLNFSNHGFPTGFFPKLMKIANEKNMIVVTSADNHGLMIYEKDPEKEARNDLMVISALTPLGLLGGFSTPMKNSFIAAAGDNVLTGADEIFGGTSVSTPLVSGVVTSVRTFLPDISFTEMKTLLFKTRILTLNSRSKVKLHGDGYLNAYLAMRVAERIREKCQSNLNKKCYAEHLKSPDTFNFQSEWIRPERWMTTFPKCAPENIAPVPSSASCQDKVEVFAELRKSSFLAPNNSTFTRALACVYKSELKLPVNALFYENLTLSIDKIPLDKVNEFNRDALRRLKGPLAQSDVEYMMSYFETLMKHFPKDINRIIESVYATLDSNQRLRIILALDEISERLPDQPPIVDIGLIETLFADLDKNYEAEIAREYADKLFVYINMRTNKEKVALMPAIAKFNAAIPEKELVQSAAAGTYINLDEERTYFAQKCRELLQNKVHANAPGLKKLCHWIKTFDPNSASQSQ